VIGDSVAFASQVSMDKRFTEIAEKILNEKGKKIEILNAGVDGYNTNQEFIALREKYLNLKPDLVIFAYCENDLAESAVQFLRDEYPQKIILKRGRKPENLHYFNLNEIEYLALVLPNQFFLNEGINRWLLLNSGIYRFVSIRMFKQRRHIKKYSDLQYNLVGFDINATLQGINKLALQNGFPVRFLLLSAPSTLQWDKEKIIDYLSKNKIIFWDCDAVVKERFGEKADIFCCLENSHLTVIGHRIVGEFLAQEINKMIDNPL
jgi:hypothetical protein